MRRVAVVMLLAGGCRQVFGLDDPSLKLGDAAATDVPSSIDAPLPTGSECLERWRSGPTFDTPVALSQVNTSASESDPWVSDDGLLLYFSRDGDLYYATRSSRDESFGAAVRDEDFSSPASETKIGFALNGTRAFFASARAGGAGGYDLWRGTKSTGEWSIDQNYLGAINTTGHEHDPHTSHDRLRLYYAPVKTTLLTQQFNQVIAVASRSSATSNFSAGVVLGELDDPDAGDADPTLTMDELVIVFTSTRSGARDLYYATRTAIEQPFTAPQPLGLNTPTLHEAGAHLSPDGCELYFEQGTTMSTGELFYARLH